MLSFMESSFLTLRYFFNFSHQVSNLFKEIFQTLCQSVNCMSWVLNISEMSRLETLYYCYLWKVLFVLFQTFFWSVNCGNLVYKLCITFWICQYTRTLFILQGSTITIKSLYVITYMWQKFGVRDVRGQIPKNIY